jgi:hypothetical protein
VAARGASIIGGTTDVLLPVNQHEDSLAHAVRNGTGGEASRPPAVCDPDEMGRPEDESNVRPAP